jgi:putative phosphoesterase
MKLAVLSDVHGNALALKAIMDDLLVERPDLVVDLGDRVSGPLWPRQTVELLSDLKPIGVRGNHDRQVAALDWASIGPSDRYAAEQLCASDIGVIAFHATPNDDATYLTEHIVANRLAHRDIVDIGSDLEEHPATLVLCGHSHRPFLGRLHRGTVVLNPGSVGCPAYSDDHPPHVSEAGSPYARYAIVEIAGAQIKRADLKAVAYPWEDAARQAERNGRPEWALGLRTGYLRSV